MQANTVEEVEQQDRLLREANEKIDRLRCAADLLIAAEFVPGSAADKRAARDNAAIEVVRHFHHSDLPTFRREAQKTLAGRETFYWPLEFPEVMVERGGFDAFVGNPPFLGGRYISGQFGSSYLAYLKSQLASNAKGNADLIAYFYLRGQQLLKLGGTTGFVGTKTVAEGDTLDVGLAQIKGCGAALFRAESSRKWPGSANVLFVTLHWRNGPWGGKCDLNGFKVPHITGRLDSTTDDKPHTLVQAIRAYQGCYVHGMGFFVDKIRREALISSDSGSASCIFPCITAEDFNSSPSMEFNRFVIYMGEMLEDEARKYRSAWHYLELNVKEERRQCGDVSLLQKWWRFKRLTKTLYGLIWQHERVLICPVVTKYLSFAWVPSMVILLNKMYAFVGATEQHFTVLQCSLHGSWAWNWSGKLKGDMQYAPSDCFDNFPFPLPEACILLGSLGDGYVRLRNHIMSSRQHGLTKTYNRFHTPDETSDDIQKLRQLHVEMDNAVAAAYGWTDLDLGHGFHETKQGTRYTIGEPARREVLARLLQLNHERYAEEVKQGLHDKKKGRAKKAKPDESGGLFE